jgi:hypothetical protein
MKVVRPERFELPACCFGGNRSIQLSYGRAEVRQYLGYHFRAVPQRALPAFAEDMLPDNHGYSRIA